VPAKKLPKRAPPPPPPPLEAGEGEGSGVGFAVGEGEGSGAGFEVDEGEGAGSWTGASSLGFGVEVGAGSTFSLVLKSLRRTGVDDDWMAVDVGEEEGTNTAEDGRGLHLLRTCLFLRGATGISTGAGAAARAMALWWVLRERWCGVERAETEAEAERAMQRRASFEKAIVVS
jgi:hypothetical protein